MPPLTYRCTKCGSDRVLVAMSKACDNNYVTLPGGQECNGYLLRGLGDSDGLCARVCLACGHTELEGFDLGTLNMSVAEMEGGNDDDDDDQSDGSDNYNTDGDSSDDENDEGDKKKNAASKRALPAPKGDTSSRKKIPSGKGKSDS